MRTCASSAHMRPKKGCTATVAPRLHRGAVPPGRTMKQFASLIVCRRPEPLLPVLRTTSVAGGVALEDGAVVLDAPRPSCGAAWRRRASSAGRGLASALARHRPDRGRHELVEGHHHRDRIARQAERTPNPSTKPNASGRPGTDRDAPEPDLGRARRAPPSRSRRLGAGRRAAGGTARRSAAGGCFAERVEPPRRGDPARCPDRRCPPRDGRACRAW